MIDKQAELIVDPQKDRAELLEELLERHDEEVAGALIEFHDVVMPATVRLAAKSGQRVALKVEFMDEPDEA